MENHILQVRPAQRRGHVDPWPENAKDERTSHFIAGQDAFPNGKGRRNSLFDLPITQQRIGQHDGNAKQPANCQNRKDDLQRICAVSCSGCEGLRDHRIHRMVDGWNAGANRRDSCHSDVSRNGFPAGNQAEGTFQGKWANQPEGHQCPERAQNPFGGLSQKKPRQDRGKDQP